jgi:hypothetical protein
MEMPETTDSPASLSPLLEDASADVTSQLPAAETTMTDLDAYTPDATGEIDAACAPLPEATAAPDATGEIEALDILEVVEVLRASRVPSAQGAPAPAGVSQSSSVPVAPPSSRAAEVLETCRLPAVMIAAPPSSVPSIAIGPAAVSGAPQGHHPSSISPIALDLTPAPRSYASASWRTPTPPDPRESTVEIARAAGIPSRGSRIVVFTASVAGMCLVAGILGVMLGYSQGPAGKAQPTSLAGTGAMTTSATPLPGTPVPRVAVVTGAHEEITEGPILVPAKDAASIADLDDVVLAPAPAPAPVPVTVLAPAAPAPRSASPAPAPRATAPAARPPSSSSASSGGAGTSSGNGASGTGVLRLPPSVTGVLIDGVPHKAGGGGLVVSCGRHTVKAPGHSSRLVIIPCGGSAAL